MIWTGKGVGVGEGCDDMDRCMLVVSFCIACSL